MVPLLEFTDNGIFCEKAGIFIDPWSPVEKAFITHAHSDHLIWGCRRYLAHRDSVPIIKHRLQVDTNVFSTEYGDRTTINGVNFSFHPAGHIPGSSQIRVEYQGEVWVASGDYKVEVDGVSIPFEPVRCHTFITESTFGLPIFSWPSQDVIIRNIEAWWKSNQQNGVTSILFAYALGKAQRILANLNSSIGPIYAHGAVETITALLHSQLKTIPLISRVPVIFSREQMEAALVIAPPSALHSPWLKKFRPYSTAAASGWMAIRGMKRRRRIDVGFIMSDHADFVGLGDAIKSTGAEKVLVTHGYTASFARWLREKGYDAHDVKTEYKGELLAENVDGTEQD